MSLFLRVHLGLGDSIILNGLVRHFAALGQVVFPCKHHNLPSVRLMFRDVPDIYVLPVTDDAEADRLCAAHKGEVLKLGMFGKDFTFTNWAECFYRQALLSPEVRYSGFYFQRDWGKEFWPHQCEYAFVHEDPARHMVIRPELLPEMTLVRAEKREGGTIFDYTGVIEGAAEIHCIDSVFLSLCDQIKTKAHWLVLHRYARPNSKENGYAGPPSLRKNWQVIK